MRKGFTLIEMSVVLSIIGLLVAGIIIAQSMVRSSQVQSIIKDVAGYQTAIQQFKQKYSALPGDMANASDYWGLNPGCGTGATGSGTQTCNGDGNGQIGAAAASPAGPYEQFNMWQHLANGGFIPGQYTGVKSARAPNNISAPFYCYPGGGTGSNCPGGKVSQQQAYLLMFYAGAIAGTTNYWDQPPGHYLIVGAETKAGAYPAYPLLSASEAYQLDSKVDDGLPGMGNWKSFEATGGAGYLTHCVVNNGTVLPPSDGTIASEPGAVYNVSYGSQAACSFLIKMGY